MPCQSDWDSSSYYMEEVNRLTRMLCGLCRNIERLVEKNTVEDPSTTLDNTVEVSAVADLIKDTVKLREWWDHHKEVDAKREAAEQKRKRLRRIRRNLIKKLTAEELEALKIDE